MAKVLVTRAHSLDQQVALDKLRSLTSELESRYGVSIDMKPGADTAKVSGRGVTGFARIEAAQVTVDLELKLPASLVAGKIEASVKKYMEQYFG